MWPMLLNLTRDECRRTLRSLELEAYSNMISVFRAQGALEDNRKKLLEELRAVLHISSDRHSAEARRVANDELLATIAERVCGPNTGLGWLCEGRRKIPLLRRGIPQTAYTELADKIAEDVAAENKEIQKRLEAQRLVASKASVSEMHDTEESTEGAIDSSNSMEDLSYPPIAMEDQTSKLWETEIICRKRKYPENGATADEVPPTKNIRNIPVNPNQKHLNLSQIYSKFSQPATSKTSGQSKHSYNQVSKVPTSKTNQSHTQKSTPRKPRVHKNKKAAKELTKAQMKKSQVQLLPSSPSKQYSPMQLDYSGPPSSFQASYAQAVLGSKSKHNYGEEMKPKVISSPGMVTDSSTMQLLTQPATVPHELGVSDITHTEDASSLQAQSTPTRAVGGKPCHLVITKRGDVTMDKKAPITEFKVLQKPTEGIKLLNKQIVVAPSSTQKSLSTGKLVHTKVISSISKSQTSNTPITTDKMIVVSKPSSAEQKSLPHSKIIITSSTVITPSRNLTPLTTNSALPKTTDTLTPKGIPATDLKVSAKTFVLNSKSGQKMVVLPAKPRTKPAMEGQVSFLNLKNISSGMKLMPVTCHAGSRVPKSMGMTVIPKPTIVNAVPSSTKIVGMETIKTANMADIVPVKGLPPLTNPKITNPIVRQANTKGNVIVLQKRATMGKTLTFAKNGNDMSKIIMGKNVNQLLQASKPDQTDATKCAGNVIVLELNNDQSGRTTTMSEILDNRSTTVARVSDEVKIQPITKDTPVLFNNQITEECNTNSLDSTSESIGDIVPMEESGLPIICKEDDGKSKDDEGKDSSSVTDWEMELDTVSNRKQKDDDDKLNSLHLDLGMSSDSDNEYMVDSRKSKSKHSSQESIQRAIPSGESSAIYSSSSGLSVAARTLLSQLQDDGSSSNDSSFALKSKNDKTKDTSKLDKCESEEFIKAKEKLTEKVAEARSQQKRIDIYSTAITTTDMNLDTFSYFEEGIMAGDDDFVSEESKAREERRAGSLDDQLSRLLGEESDSQSEGMPLNKK